MHRTKATNKDKGGRQGHRGSLAAVGREKPERKSRSLGETMGSGVWVGA